MSHYRFVTLTLADQAIIEGMLHCEHGSTGPRAFALRRKLADAVVVPASDIAPDIATLGSRVRYRLDGGPAEERVLLARHAIGVPTLLAWTCRGLALLGMRVGEETRVIRLDGSTEVIALEAVPYQPQADQRARAAAFFEPRPPASPRRVGAVRRLRRPDDLMPDAGDDDRGPGAA